MMKKEYEAFHIWMERAFLILGERMEASSGVIHYYV